jgi:hypothetical protein
MQPNRTQKTDELDIEQVKGTLFRLEELMSNEKYAGFDPYDIKGSKIFMWAFALPRKPFYRNIQRKLVLAPLIIGESYFPRFSRWLFGIKPTRNAKGIALIAKGYLNLYKLTEDEKWKTKAVDLLDWLLGNQSSGYPYPCWGYPFDWATSEVIIPAHTPASVVSAAVFDVFWEAWLITKDERYLNTCTGICHFFGNHLNITKVNGETICFSYTPLDNYQVHNTNLLVADCLLRAGFATNDLKFISQGKMAANFALVEQNSNGSIFYYGRAQDYINPKRVDHYHSGFEMRCLHSIWQTTGDELYQNALKKYFSFYKGNLVKSDADGTFPHMYPGVKYPINIHSCAEAILLNATLAQDYDCARDILDQIVMPILEQMVTRKGWFKYMIRKVGPFEVHTSIPYMRWGQAWMFLALSEALLAANNKSGG